MPPTPKVCEDIEKLTDSIRKDTVPLTSPEISPAVDSQSDFEFTVGTSDVQTGTQTVSYKVTVTEAEEDSSLVVFDIMGNFNYFTVTIGKDGETVSPIRDVKDELTQFEPSTRYEFDMETGKLEKDDIITITFVGPKTGFNVNFTEFVVCLPVVMNNYCQLTYDDTVRAMAGMELLDEVLGTTEDGVIVNYSFNMSDGDILETGVVVYGHCFQCECETMNGTHQLVCSIVPDCVCPNFTQRCEGDCYNSQLIVEYNATGVPKHCLPNDTVCEQECTTPYTCPTEWSEWSSCVNCMRTRRRSCDEDVCNCNNRTLVESDECDVCYSTISTQPTTVYPTTPYCDPDSEEWKCYNHYIRCNETCRNLMDQGSCDNLNVTIDEDMPCNYSCACAHGYARNDAGQCVKQETCECYIGNKALPVGYKFKNECMECNCTMGVGLVCTPDPDCYTTATPMPSTITPTEMPTTEMPTTPTTQNDTCQKTWVEDKVFTFNNENYGLCTSDTVPVHKCHGTCEFSRSGGAYFEYSIEDIELPMFDIDYQSDCECCQATMEAAEVKFECVDGTNRQEIHINVTSIVACNCLQCR